MARDHWDAILASAPLNATAATVTGKGYGYTSEKKIVDTEWDVCPPLRSLDYDKARSKDFVDLTGIVFGRLRVIGMAMDKGGAGKNKPALWVCRCSCGRYCGRRAKAIKAAAPDNRCQQCQHTAYLARSASGDHARRRAESEKARKW